ncbi:hypothetical protein QN367_06810 [Cryobacterium sp. RTS3]|uniref:hypothetical protein n=1 Tax=Cryobacterium sp. RTS3 TaxID=3048643 RepID=UPI002B239FF6|nr:hypothetical protein [Cryobacterium sp. RTS3]MEA9998803.1 hypothetical protein [Cryobacterium sp. RTS3]
MAESPSHALGQIAGYTMEQAFFDMLLPVANEFSLYVDRQGPRLARGVRRKVSWVDDHQNKHDLDFVLERGGTAQHVGAPAAFIESAWRRYTKHSVNKAGEITNALVPLRRTYRYERPFLGALVAGEWTRVGILNMESQGISVLHLPVATLADAFAVEGVDLNFDEHTLATYMSEQVARWNEIGPEGHKNVIVALRKEAAEQFVGFIDRMREHLSRKVQSVSILPLHGLARLAVSVSEALAMLSAMATVAPSQEALELVRIEIQVRYSNTDKIDASFRSLSEAILWLEQNYLDS